MQKMQKSNRLIYTSITTALVIVLDQITKLIVSGNMEVGESFGLIPYIMNIHFVRNKGAAFGMLADQRWIFMTFSVIALGIMFYVLKKTNIRSHLFYISMAFIIGGGIGNMIDRTIYGSVIDFMEFDFVSFAIFNVADAFLTAGVIMMAVYLLFIEKKDKQKSEKDAEGQPEQEKTTDENGGTDET